MFAKLRDFFKFFSKRSVLLAVLISVATVFFIHSATKQFKTVTVNADGKTFTVTTPAKSAVTLLSRNGIVLGQGDEVEPLFLEEGVTVSVKRAFPLEITLGTDSFTVYTVPKPLSEVFEYEGITLGEHDVVSPSPDTVVNSGTKVIVTRIQVNEERTAEEIPFNRKFRANSSMKRNSSNIVTAGENGIREAVYRVTITNGTETSRELVAENVIKKPVTEVVEYGAEETTALTEKATPETVSVLASCEYIDCKAYSYILHGATATGIGTRRGVIAVDPKVIPLGTRVYVQSLDGKADYGYAVAGDTGGMIKGNTIDMWVPTYAEAAQNGVRKMRVYILPE